MVIEISKLSTEEIHDLHAWLCIKVWALKGKPEFNDLDEYRKRKSFQGIGKK